MSVSWLFDPRHLRMLEAIVRLGSFAAAAEELGYTQSAVSQQVAELEHRVGTAVVTRRPVRLTDAGQVLLHAEGAISTSMSLAAVELTALAQGSTGVVRLGAFISAAASIAPPALAQLRATHPGVRLILREMDQGQTHAALLRGDLDLAITFDYLHAPSAAPRGVCQEHLIDDPIMVVLPDDHPLAAAVRVDPFDIEPSEWINTNVDVAGVAIGDLPGRPQSLDFEGQDFRTALNLVAAGLGVALLPTLALHQAPPGVITRPMAGDMLVRRLYTARLDTARVSLPVRRLEASLRDVATAFKETPQALRP